MLKVTTKMCLDSLPIVTISDLPWNITRNKFFLALRYLPFSRLA